MITAIGAIAAVLDIAFVVLVTIADTFRQLGLFWDIDDFNQLEVDQDDAVSYPPRFTCFGGKNKRNHPMIVGWIFWCLIWVLPTLATVLITYEAYDRGAGVADMAVGVPVVSASYIVMVLTRVLADNYLIPKIAVSGRAVSLTTSQKTTAWLVYGVIITGMTFWFITQAVYISFAQDIPGAQAVAFILCLVCVSWIVYYRMRLYEPATRDSTQESTSPTLKVPDDTKRAEHVSAMVIFALSFVWIAYCHATVGNSRIDKTIPFESDTYV